MHCQLFDEVCEQSGPDDLGGVELTRGGLMNKDSLDMSPADHDRIDRVPGR